LLRLFDLLIVQSEALFTNLWWISNCSEQSARAVCPELRHILLEPNPQNTVFHSLPWQKMPRQFHPLYLELYKLQRLFVFLLKFTNYSVRFLYHFFVQIVVIDVGWTTEDFIHSYFTKYLNLSFSASASVEMGHSRKHPYHPRGGNRKLTPLPPLDVLIHLLLSETIFSPFPLRTAEISSVGGVWTFSGMTQ
jgi:hypothetical protein